MDRVIETPDGFDCIVQGKRFGTWRSRGEARAGMETEQRRAAARPGLTQEQWDEIVTDFCTVA